MIEDNYTVEYFEMINENEAEQARRLADWIVKRFAPKSVIDFGCATGLYIEPFTRLYYKNEGIQIKGIELSDNAQDPRVVRAPGYIEKFDLSLDFFPAFKYNVGLCVEVLEHIPEEFADTIVHNIARNSETCIVSAARPGQGGEYHHNEQLPEYWIKKFEGSGKMYDGKATQELIAHLKNGWHMTWVENLLVFV